MTDHREKHAQILGYMLIISAIGIFTYNYFEVSNQLKAFGTEDLLWDALYDTLPTHIIAICIGIFSFRLSLGLAAGHPKAVLWWTILCVFLLGDSLYILSIKFHIIILLKALLLLYLTGYALFKYKQKFDSKSNDHLQI